MLKLITIVSLVCMFAACSSDKGTENKVYGAQKEQLAKQEKKAPLAFLKVYASDKKNIFGSTVVKGAVSNTATVCSYKNIRVKLMGYDAGGKMLEEHEDVINGLIKPNSSKDFKLRYHLPKNTDSVAVNVMNATVAE